MLFLAKMPVGKNVMEKIGTNKKASVLIYLSIGISIYLSAIELPLLKNANKIIITERGASFCNKEAVISCRRKFFYNIFDVQRSKKLPLFYIDRFTGF